MMIWGRFHIPLKKGIVGTKLLRRHRPRMEEKFDKLKDVTLVALSLYTATLITCLSIAFALL
jgi:hypothetical protein